MKKSFIGVIGLLVLLTIFISVSFVSAGLLDRLNDFFSVGTNNNNLKGELGSASLNTQSGGLVHEWNFDNDLKDSVGRVNLRNSKRISYIPTESGTAVDLKIRETILKSGLRSGEKQFLNPYSNKESSLAFCGKIDEIYKLNQPFIFRRDSFKGSYDGLELSITKEKRLSGYVLGSYPYASLNCDKNVVDGKWHSIILTATSTSTNISYVYITNQKMYVDGVLCNKADGRQNRWLNNVPLIIRNYKGAIDKLSIYHSVLTDDEINGLSSDCLNNNE